jgi:hypothetical protein
MATLVRAIFGSEGYSSLILRDKQGDHPGDDYLFGRAFRIFLAALQFSITKLFHRLRIDIYPSQRNGKRFTAKEGLGSSSLINRGWLKTNQEIFR